MLLLLWQFIQQSIAVCKRKEAERSSALIPHWLKWTSNFKHHSGEELFSDTTPLAQMELQTKRSERR
jgi:hypothetical protein